MDLLATEMLVLTLDPPAFSSPNKIPCDALNGSHRRKKTEKDKWKDKWCACVRARVHMRVWPYVCVCGMNYCRVDVTPTGTI